jgi:hypothetical protein
MLMASQQQTASYTQKEREKKLPTKDIYIHLLPLAIVCCWAAGAV